MAALGPRASRRTAFRKLKDLAARTSYSHRGGFYTLDELADFDPRGLWSFAGVRFSRLGTLIATAESFVRQAEAGHLVDELDNLLGVGTQDALRKLVGDGRLTRHKLAGQFLYCAADHEPQTPQLRARRLFLASPGLVRPLPDADLMPEELRTAGVRSPTVVWRPCWLPGAPARCIRRRTLLICALETAPRIWNLMNGALDDLACEFFRTFARLEYALKATGHYRDHRTYVEPNWTTFARVEPVRRLLDDPGDPGLREAIGYMMTRPPRRQVIANGTLTWREDPPNTLRRPERVLQLVRQVRNNLFHGGKTHQDDPQRTERLLRHSLTILLACREASPDVAGAYRHGR